MKVFYFNFSHDVQLAFGRSLYNLNKNVRSLEFALQPLAVFAAESGDAVAVQPEMVSTCEDFYCKEPLLKGIKFVACNEIPQDAEIEPWGWDIGLEKVVKNKAMLLPDERLDSIRQLSSRESVKGCLESVLQMLPNESLCGESFFCKTIQEIKACLQHFGMKVVLKAPWSSSGRGLRFVDTDIQEDTLRWCNNVLLSQGGVEVEPFYQKMSDWAMEFFADKDGMVRYTGLSHFFTSPLAGYTGGRVASQDVLLKEWQQQGSLGLLENVKCALESILGVMVKGIYCGPLGVDMMFCKGEDGRILLHPCVEINFRRTMGQMALMVSDRLLKNEVQGQFEIHFESSSTQLKKYIENLGKKCCLLTPITEKTTFAAYIVFE